MNRDKEEAANGGRPYHYTYVGSYAGASRARRGVPTEENPNPNRTVRLIDHLIHFQRRYSISLQIHLNLLSIAFL